MAEEGSLFLCFPPHAIDTLPAPSKDRRASARQVLLLLVRGRRAFPFHSLSYPAIAPSPSPLATAVSSPPSSRSPMKSTRTTTKARPARLPYSTTMCSSSNSSSHTSSLLAQVAHSVGAVVAKANFLRKPPWGDAHGASKLAENRLSSSSSAKPPALAPGGIVRDLAFFTQASEVTFFSTHPSLCARVFGVLPGEVFEMGGERSATSSDSVDEEAGGRVAEKVIVVVGARGGRLWVWTYGDEAARILRVPASTTSCTPSSAAEVRVAIVEHYQLRQLVHSSWQQRSAGGAKVREQDVQVELVRTVHEVFQSLCTRAQEEVKRLYTEDQLAFLQRAPDLYAAATKRVDWAASSSDATSPAAGESSVPQRRQPDHAPEMSSSLFSSSSIYADIAHHAPNAAAVVLLAPCVLPRTGAIGWVGEGDVVLTDALMGHEGSVEASLSASVVI